MCSIGKKIKRVLDYGRIQYLREELKFDNAKLVQFCEAKYSPEGYLIVASKNS
jgi:hypothetical protein